MEIHRTRGADAPESRAPGRRSGPEPVPLGSDLLEDYRIEGHLGRGGMGTVYLVRSASSRRRFAVKRILPEKAASAFHRQAFLRELLTWSELPEHPTLTPLRFFRTLGEELLIFSDYVEGGSLRDWIEQGRLRDPAQILETAILIARGLAIAHAYGVIHQDVKPGNVLMTPNGMTRLTDFGLARAAAGAPEATESVGPEAATHTSSSAPLVSCGGSTPEFCSPEQSRLQPVGPTTDVWSWGLTVLALYQGGVTWISGLAASEVLELHVNRGPPDEGLPVLPAPVARVLQDCFHRRPASRWPGFVDLIVRLEEIHRDLFHRAPRKLPPAPQPSDTPAGLDRSFLGGKRWEDPRIWLDRIRSEGGSLDPMEAKPLIAPRGSRRGRAIADLAAYDTARRSLQRLFERGRHDLLLSLTQLCRQKATIHQALGDSPGCRALLDDALSLLEPAERAPEDPSLTLQRAWTWSEKGNLLLSLGDLEEASIWQQRAAEAAESLVARDASPQHRACLGKITVNQANLMGRRGEPGNALEGYDSAIRLFRQLISSEGCSDLEDDLAVAWVNRADAVRILGTSGSFLEDRGRAIEIWTRLVSRGRQDLRDKLAWTLVSQGTDLAQLGKSQEALEHYEQGLELLETLVGEGRRDVAWRLAAALLNKGALLHGTERAEEGGRLEDRAIHIMEDLVHREGRRDLSVNLALAYSNRSVDLAERDRPQQARRLVDRAIAIYHRLLEKAWQPRIAHYLARALRNRALALAKLGDADGALEAYDRGIDLLRRLIHEDQQGNLRGFLAAMRMHRATLRAETHGAEAVRPELREALAALQAEVERTDDPSLRTLWSAARRRFEPGY